MEYRPRIIKGTVRNTGYPIDGHVLYFSQWDYDNYEYYHLYGWLGETTEEAVMRTMYQAETEAGLCLYDTPEEFVKAWKEKNGSAGGILPRFGTGGVLEVLQEEHIEEN